MNMKRIVLALFGLTGSFAVSMAHAEGCEGLSQHAPDAKQKAYYVSTYKVLRNAVPKPLAGWQYADSSAEQLDPGYDPVPDYLCGDTSNYFIGLDAAYERPMSQADQDKMQQLIETPPDPAKQKELETLMAQQQALIEKTVAVAQKHDAKTMEALSKQGDALNAKISKVQLEMNAKQTATMQALQYDREAKVHISINDAGDANCYGSPKPITVPDAVAYECENPATYSAPGEQLDAPSGHVLVVFGKGVRVDKDDWDRMDNQGQHHDDGGVIFRYTAQSTLVPVVQFVTLDVEGDDLNRALSVYKMMNLAPLAALVKK